MRFDSYTFPLFLLVVLSVYWALRRSVRLQNWLILVSSYVFYGWWNPWFLTLIAASTFIDYFVAIKIAETGDESRRRRLLMVSLVANLGLLGVFKYFNFFVESAVTSFGALGVELHPWTLQILLPVGISFYTFQTLSYTIDVYRKDFEAERDLLAFASYVAFFPQLVAGPIERATTLVPQFRVPRTLDVERVRSAMVLIVFGLVKKVAIADNMAPMADYVYGLPTDQLTGPLVLAGTAAFAMQIYADFSAYSDIARGTSRLMGFELCVNFDKPYLAMTPSDFWRRWHISLSQWLRDYLYISLGGNRGAVSRTYRNLMITMVLGGLWHGAAWNYVFWGVFHGTILCVYRFLRLDDVLAKARVPARLAATVLFFGFTLYGWLLFRAVSLDHIGALSRNLWVGWGEWSLAAPILLVVAYFSVPIAAHHFLSWRLYGEKWVPANVWLARAALGAVVLYGITHARASETAFIYFQF